MIITYEIPTALLERHAVLQSPHRIEELVNIFIHATKVYVSSYVRNVMKLTRGYL